MVGEHAFSLASFILAVSPQNLAAFGKLAVPQGGSAIGTCLALFKSGARVCGLWSPLSAHPRRSCVCGEFGT
jgi:hypothetical protein